MLRIAIFIAYAVTLSPFYYPIMTAMTILTAIVVAAVKPYKSSVQNTVDIFLLLVLALASLSLGANIFAGKVDFKFLEISRLMIYASASVPLVYLFALLLHNLCCQRTAIKRIFRRVLAITTNGRNRTDSMDSLPIHQQCEMLKIDASFGEGISTYRQYKSCVGKTAGIRLGL